MLVRAGGTLRAFDAACPHYGVDLSDGALDSGALHCPGCGVAFDARTGECPSPALTLKQVPVKEEGGLILLDLSQSADESMAVS